MKSQVKFFLVALAMIGLCIGFMTAAQAESMYVGCYAVALFSVKRCETP